MLLSSPAFSEIWYAYVPGFVKVSMSSPVKKSTVPFSSLVAVLSMVWPFSSAPVSSNVNSPELSDAPTSSLCTVGSTRTLLAAMLTCPRFMAMKRALRRMRWLL